MPVGRPPKINNEILQKLRTAFMMGCTDVEACLYSEINPRTLYDHQNRHPKFTQLKQYWKEYPVLKARKRLNTAISDDSDSHTFKWYLERARRREFGNVQTIEHTGNIEISEAMDRSKLAKAIEAVAPKQLPEKTD